MAALAERDQARAQLAGYQQIARELWKWLLSAHPDQVAEFRAWLDNVDSGGDGDAGKS